MPETFALFFIITIATLSYVASKVQARNPAIWNAREELKRLRVLRACLEERLQLARRENWEGEMCDSIVAQLRATRFQLAHMTAEMDESSER